MDHLLADTQTLPFIKNETVQLPILKQQIDRRILKIKALLKQKSKKRCSSSSKQVLDKFVQTESTPNLVKSLAWQETTVLAPSCRFNPNLQPRSSLPIKPVNNHCSGQGKENNVKLMKKRVNKLNLEHRYNQNGGNSQTLLQSNGFTFRGEPQSRQQSSLKKNTLVSQGDLDDRSDFMKESHNDLYDSQIQGRFRGRHTLSPLDFAENNRSDVARLSFFTDLSSSHRTKTDFSHRRILRTKSKYQQEDIILPQPQRRIVVSTICLQKMKSHVLTLIPRRRKQFWDTNLRSNVLKRLEQKYHKEIYQN